MKNSTLEHFGKRVREFRSKLQISQEELADRSNLHRTYIGGIERGERNITLLNLFELAKALDVTPQALLEGVISDG